MPDFVKKDNGTHNRIKVSLSSLLVNQLIERVTVNGQDDVSISFSFESGFERVMEVLGNE